MTSTAVEGTPAERLLRVAGELFAREGIRAVGIDRLLAEAEVAKASLYQCFGSKDALVVAYLERQHDQDVHGFERAAARVADDRGRALLPFDLAARKARRRDFRGCLYLNAATEFPGRGSPVAGIVAEHRAWLDGVWRAALGGIGHHDPGAGAAALTVLYDGGLAGSKATRSTAPIETARAMATEVLGPVVDGHVRA